MASLDKLPPMGRYPKGRYKVRYKKPDGSAGSRNFVRRDEAVRFQHASGADIDRGDWIDPKTRRSKFDSWAASYERSLVRLAPTTSRRYSQYLHNHVLPFFAGWPIAWIDYQRRGLHRPPVREEGCKREAVALTQECPRRRVRPRTGHESRTQGEGDPANPAAENDIRVPKQHGQVLALEQLLEIVENVPGDYWR